MEIHSLEHLEAVHQIRDWATTSACGMGECGTTFVVKKIQCIQGDPTTFYLEMVPQSSMMMYKQNLKIYILFNAL